MRVRNNNHRMGDNIRSTLRNMTLHTMAVINRLITSLCYCSPKINFLVTLTYKEIYLFNVIPWNTSVNIAVSFLEWVVKFAETSESGTNPPYTFYLITRKHLLLDT